MTSKTTSKTAESETPTWVHYTVLVVAQLAVGSAAILARAGLTDGLGPISLSAWRLTVASAALLFIGSIRSIGRQSSARLAPRDTGLLILAGFLLGLHFAAWFASLQRIPVARSTLLVCTSPVFTGLIAVIVLRQRIPARFWWGLMVAAIGAVGVTWRAGTALNAADSAWTGDILALAGALAIALYLL